MANHKGNGGFMIKGGINLDDIDKYPEANYWRSYALGAREALYREFAMFEIEIKNTLKQVWRDENTWRDIDLQTEIMLAALRAHRDVLYAQENGFSIVLNEEVKSFHAESVKQEAEV